MFYGAYQIGLIIFLFQNEYQRAKIHFSLLNLKLYTTAGQALCKFYFFYF